MRYVATSWDVHMPHPDALRVVSGTIEGLTERDMPTPGDLVEVKFGKIVGNAYVTSLSGTWTGTWRADVVMTGKPIDTEQTG